MAEREECCFTCISTFPVWVPSTKGKYPVLTPSTCLSQAGSATELSQSTTYDYVEQFTEDTFERRGMSTDEAQPAHLALNIFNESPNSQQQTRNCNMKTQEQDIKVFNQNLDTDEATRMICNIPCRFGQDEIIEAIHSVGFDGLYDFVYVPLRTRKRSGNIGYAFAQLKSPDLAVQFEKAFQNYQFAGTSSVKKCVVRQAHLQGFNGFFTKPNGKERTQLR